MTRTVLGTSFKVEVGGGGDAKSLAGEVVRAKAAV